eukprot:TRINITY_DN21244_c0_g1_i1.p1 TRINITY_DN21244_c0_g1~~TRINITY_DN21244_c0_g1_i1.p1  ORF type:complete len:183 (+),score=38.14 TRINITY_DN21244_c0_g1_i1:60-551(+)
MCIRDSLKVARAFYGRDDVLAKYNWKTDLICFASEFRKAEYFNVKNRRIIKKVLAGKNQYVNGLDIESFMSGIHPCKHLAADIFDVGKIYVWLGANIRGVYAKIEMDARSIVLYDFESKLNICEITIPRDYPKGANFVYLRRLNKFVYGSVVGELLSLSLIHI